MFLFFVVVGGGGAQTVIRLLQTTQIISDFVLYLTMLLTPAQIKPKSFESRRNFFFSFLFTRGGCVYVYVRGWALGCFYSHISTRTFRRALTALLDSCAEIKSAPSVA